MGKAMKMSVAVRLKELTVGDCDMHTEGEERRIQGFGGET
jgi:hypothetical protein